MIPREDYHSQSVLEPWRVTRSKVDAFRESLTASLEFDQSRELFSFPAGFRGPCDLNSFLRTPRRTVRWSSGRLKGSECSDRGSGRILLLHCAGTDSLNPFSYAKLSFGGVYDDCYENCGLAKGWRFRRRGGEEWPTEGVAW